MTQNNSYLKQVQILFGMIAVTPLVFLCVVIYLHSGLEKPAPDYNNPLLYFSVAISTVLIIASIMIPKLRLPSVRQKEMTGEKLDSWKSIFITRIAMIEGAALINIVCLYTTQMDVFLYIAVALITFQFLNLPTRNKIKDELNLNEEETANL